MPMRSGLFVELSCEGGHSTQLPDIPQVKFEGSAELR